MAVITQILLGVYRDKKAPWNQALGVTAYVPTVGKSFNINTIKEISNVTENSVVYGTFLHHETDGEPAERIYVIQASGTIVSLCNS